MYSANKEQKMDDPAHIQLKQNILDEVHINKLEHKENYIQFTGSFLFYALLGIISGGLIDIVSKKARNNSNSKIKCIGILILQLSFVGSVFYLFMKVKFKSGISFDDWMMATWTGFIFSLAFFTSQRTISELIQVAFS
jgi:hypothetical protein